MDQKQTIEVPLSTSMWHYIESSDYVSAYQVACLGVTEADWHTLALSSLQGQAWDVARKGFIRVQNVCYLDLLNWLQQGHGSHFNKSTLTALVLAYEVHANNSILYTVVPIHLVAYLRHTNSFCLQYPNPPKDLRRDSLLHYYMISLEQFMQAQVK
jgi:hypothetical protein